MKIRLAILEKDSNYLNRFVSAFNTRYADKFEIYSFTDMAIAVSTLESRRVDVLIASDAFEIDTNALPKRCGFAYFVDSLDIDCIRDQKAICKFQKVDLIYKQILSVYSEKAEHTSTLKLGDGKAKVIAFTSVGCGAGTSTMAAAAAMYLTRKNKKTLYLNLEEFGSADSFFSGAGKSDMSDIVFALKSKKANIPLKLEGCVKQDVSGVYFYSESKIALDMHELTNDNIMTLLSELRLTGAYDYIVIDFSFGIEKDVLELLRQAYAIVWVGNGTEISNRKISRAYMALSTIEQDADFPLTNRLMLIYNKFSNKSGRTVGDIGIKNIGGAPRYEQATNSQILQQLCRMDMFEKMM